ncbi:MAG: hypothetical protein OIF36_02795 [Alphaproteobacteria bacterium]|nr:hypothetical protein [Alphaproteobacteria bacterium]
MSFKKDLERIATQRLLRKFKIANYFMSLSDLQKIAGDYGKTNTGIAVARYTRVIDILSKSNDSYFGSDAISSDEKEFITDNIDLVNEISEDIADHSYNALDLCRSLSGMEFDFNNNEQIVKNLYKSINKKDVFSFVDILDKSGVVISEDLSKNIVTEYNDDFYRSTLKEVISDMNRKNSRVKMKVSHEQWPELTCQ